MLRIATGSPRHAWKCAIRRRGGPFAKGSASSRCQRKKLSATGISALLRTIVGRIAQSMRGTRRSTAPSSAVSRSEKATRQIIAKRTLPDCTGAFALPDLIGCQQKWCSSSAREKMSAVSNGPLSAATAFLARLRSVTTIFLAKLRELLDSAYPARTAIKLILDNHSAHISRETKAWLADQPVHRFEFTFTPNHGSCLNLVEGFFSKLARSVLRHIRVSSKQDSRIASWPPWIISTTIPSFTPGPTSSIRPHDTIRTSKSRV